MRVLVLTVVHDPEDARVRYRQIPALVAAGHEVTLAASFTDHGRELPEDIASIDIPRAHGRHRLPAILRARRLLRARAHEFDVVLMHDPELLLSALGLKVRHLVWDVHEDTVATLRLKAWLPRFVRPPVAAVARWAERSAERRMHLLLAEESYVERFTRSHPVIPNSVVPPEQVSEGADHRVVYIGRVSAARGAGEMIELGRRLAPEIELHVFGGAEPDCIEMLRTAHAERAIVWHGFVPNAEALARLDGALAGLSLLHDQPNYAHSVPTKMLEYLAHGVPVVSTPNPVSRRLVEEGDCGVLVPFGDVAAAERAVRALHADHDERDRLAKNGRAMVLAKYDWRVDAQRFVEALEDVAKA